LSYKNWTSSRALIAFVALLLGGCENSQSNELRAKGRLFIVTDQMLVLQFDPYFGNPQCIPKSQYSDSESIFLYDKSDKIIPELMSNNKEIYFIGSFDMADGLDVVGKRKRKIYIDLSSFVTVDEEIERINVKLKYFDCTDISKENIPYKTLDININGSDKLDFR
jgi:hypothetical protein